MSEKIEPALTPDEWARQRIETRNPFGGLINSAEAMPTTGAPAMLRIEATHGAAGFCDQTRHALAALALHGQPFGFTREDVDHLRGVAVTFGPEIGDPLRDLAARIAALLPPREP